MVISASLQAWGVVFPFAMLTSICRSIVTICSGLYLLIGMTRFSSKWILSHSTWYKFRRSGHGQGLLNRLLVQKGRILMGDAEEAALQSNAFQILRMVFEERLFVRIPQFYAAFRQTTWLADVISAN